MLLPRAWALAEQLAQRPPLVTRFTRAILTQQVKRLILDSLGYGLALEGLGVVDGRPNSKAVEFWEYFEAKCAFHRGDRYSQICPQ